ncbi:MAG: CehA/McbA family metallohydrolase [Treponema sp.]|jgi:hypothetical protein|nr:CehA/McbA family metallohydrolase [Treponema sp.]
MKEIRFDQSYSVDDAGKYVKLPFEVPDGIERIEVEYDYPRFVEETLSDGTSRREANIIDLGLYDETGNLYGWSGSNRRSIFTASIAASPGYRRGIIHPGTWAVALGLYKIENRLLARVIVRLYRREGKLYRGDLHLHTRNSDGAYTTAQAIRYSEEAGLDFIALTDHNNLEQNSEIGNPGNSENSGNSGLSVIPGVEFTNYRGHANFFFPDPVPRFGGDFLVNSFDEMAALFRRAKDAGALISINHPFSDCPWEFGYDNFPFDMIEVWNGPMAGFNLRAVEKWHELLCRGRKITALAGSDTHIHELGRTFGSPCTQVRAESPAPPALLAALAAGRCSLAYAPRGPHLDLEIAGAGLGGSVPFRPGLEGRAVVSGARQGDILKVIHRDGLAQTFTAPFNGVYRPCFPVEDRSFYRLELYRTLLDQSALCGLSNPVYIGINASQNDSSDNKYWPLSAWNEL